jgi:hypothetical protein
MQYGMRVTLWATREGLGEPVVVTVPLFFDGPDPRAAFSFPCALGDAGHLELATALGDEAALRHVHHVMTFGLAHLCDEIARRNGCQVDPFDAQPLIAVALEELHRAWLASPTVPG